MARLWHWLDRLSGGRHIMLAWRWLAWGLALLLVAIRQPAPAAWGSNVLLLSLSGGAVVALALSLPYFSHPRSLLGAAGIDVLIGLAVLVLSDAWSSPYLFYSYSTLLLPYLLLTRRRRLLLGLLFALADLGALLLGSVPLLVLLREHGAALLLRLSTPLALALLMRAEQLPLLPARLSGDQRLIRVLESAARRFHRIASLAGPASAGREASTLVEVQVSADRGERELQGLLVLLRPPDAGSSDLVAQLRELAASFHDRSGVEAVLTVEGQPRALAAAVEATLVGVTSEALTNIEKHAHAAEAEIVLRYENTGIVLIIRDNGVGLMDGPIDRPGFHGLRAVQYRVAELNGQLEVFEGEVGGVVVRVTVPFEVYAA